MWAYLQRRRLYIWIAVVLLVVAGSLLWYSRSLPDYGKNLSLNLGADLIGAIIVLFAVSPFLARAEIQGDTVRDGFDRGRFIKNASDAKNEIFILELWTDLLQGGYQDKFLNALQDALRQKVRIRILLLSPYGHAAEQRADDLLRRTDVAGDILDNLRILYEFVYGRIPDAHRRYIEVRIYSALPPVQMFKVDNQVIVSFYPVNIISWNATQYLTTPDSQLGKFVGDKFDELWEARSTRTLKQFREMRVITASAADEEKTYLVEFVMSGEDIYISGQRIVADHAENGIAGLTLQIVDENVTGESGVRGPFALLSPDTALDGYASVPEVFQRKYGRDHHVILKLVDKPAL